MEKQVRVQVIGGLKRNVVAGQFEDPDDDVIVPKRMKMTTANDDDVTIAVPQEAPVLLPIRDAPLASLPIAVSAAPVPALVATTKPTAQSQLPVPIMPHPALIPSMMQMPVSFVPVPMMPHPMHPAAAVWQYQQQAFVISHMLATVHPMMHHMHQQFLQRTMTIQIPPDLDQIQHQQHSQQHQRLPPQSSTAGTTQTASDPPVEVDKEWRIPYSHNFHPQTGFFQDPEATDATATPATTTIKCKPTNGRTCTKGAVILKAPLDDSFLSEFDFPRIKEDAEKRFGLKAREINAVDVLCGRGGVTNSHEGNIQFRNLANQYRWHYATVKKSRKAHVARYLVKKIRDQHGRFLKKEADDTWYEIGDELALAKAAQTLREGLAKIYRDEMTAKMVIDRTSMSSTELPASAEPFSTADDESSKSST